MSQFPATHVILPTTSHTHTIILLHGRGSNGPEFAEELFEARLSNGMSLPERMPGWKWVFPTSRKRYSTVFQEEMDEWFDVYSLTDPSFREELQTEGLRESIAFIQSVIENEVKALAGYRDRLVVGGISQGCASAIRAVLGLPQIGAFVGFCGWMPPSDLCDVTVGNHTPIFLSHAQDDDVVDFELGRKLQRILVGRLGMNVTWKDYENGGHWINEPQGFDDWTGFLGTLFGTTALVAH